MRDLLLLENTKNSLGWNCFSLEYACNDPEVGIVLTNEVRSLYYKVSSFIMYSFGLKRLGF
jgi:hypothetical protein